MDLPIEKHVHDVVCPFCTAKLTVDSPVPLEKIFLAGWTCPLCDNQFVMEYGVTRKPTES